MFSFALKKSEDNEKVILFINFSDWRWSWRRRTGASWAGATPGRWCLCRARETSLSWSLRANLCRSASDQDFPRTHVSFSRTTAGPSDVGLRSGLVLLGLTWERLMSVYIQAVFLHKTKHCFLVVFFCFVHRIKMKIWINWYLIFSFVL